MCTSNREFLIGHYLHEEEPLKPGCYETVVIGAMWRCIPIRKPDGKGILLAVRSSDMGFVDSLSIPADTGEVVEIATSDADTSLGEVLTSVMEKGTHLQGDEGLPSGVDRDAGILGELVDAIMSNNQHN